MGRFRVVKNFLFLILFLPMVVNASILKNIHIGYLGDKIYQDDSKLYDKDYNTIYIIVELDSNSETNVALNIKNLGERVFKKLNPAKNSYKIILTKEDINKLISKDKEDGIENIYIHELASNNKKKYGEYLYTKYSAYSNKRITLASNSPNLKNEIQLATQNLLINGGFIYLNINIGNITRKLFIKNQADWIVYIGHGSSLNGTITASAKENALSTSDYFNWIYPSQLRWKGVKGFLSFGCSIIDIGDFGKQNNLSGKAHDIDCSVGNYCKEYYGEKTDKEIYESPNPGLKWKKIIEDGKVDNILGFNFKAPLIFGNGGATLLESFLTKFYNNNNFLESWKQISLNSIIERGYLRKDGDSIKYSFARATAYSTIKWQEERFIEEWLMFSKCFNSFSDMSYEDVIMNKRKDLYGFYVCSLKNDGVIDGNNGKFNPTKDLNRAELLKMALVAKDKRNKNKKAKDSFDDVDVFNSWYRRYIPIAVKDGIIVGYGEEHRCKKDICLKNDDFSDEEIKKCQNSRKFCPLDHIRRDHASKIIVRTLIGGVDGMDNYIKELKRKCVKPYELDLSKVSINITRAETAYLIYKAKGNETCKVD